MSYSYYSFLGEALAGGALYKGIKGVQTGEKKNTCRELKTEITKLLTSSIRKCNKCPKS